MKTIKVSEATNTQLDYLVAKCEGKVETGVYETPEVVERKLHLFYCNVLLTTPYTPTTNPIQMWPIIEREEIVYTFYRDRAGPDDRVHARLDRAKLKPGDTNGTCWYAPAKGSTILQAAARCYVMSKLGNEVEVPDEL